MEYGGASYDCTKRTYPLVSVALCRDLEAAGGDRRVDRALRGDGARHRAGRRRRDRQLDHCRCDRRCAAGIDRFIVVLPRLVLTKKLVRVWVRTSFTF